MGLLDKLRPQPKWKHADPLVRAAAVHELGPDDRDALRELVLADPDTRVRGAAVARALEPSLLAEALRRDTDAEVRETAASSLVAAVLDDDSDAAAEMVAGALADTGHQRELVTIARNAVAAGTRHAALGRVADEKLVAAVARKAQDRDTRLEALARLSDAELLQDVAMRSEHADVATAALDRIGDPEALNALAQRAKTKVAARRARARVRALEEAARSQTVSTADPIPMTDEERRRAAEIIDAVTALVPLGDPEAVRSALGTHMYAWAEFQADVDVEPALTERFEVARDRVRAALAEHERVLEEQRRRAAEIAREQADRVAVIEAIETLEGADVAERLQALKEAWAQLPAMPESYAADLTARYDRTVADVDQRFDRERQVEVARARLAPLVDEIEQLAGHTSFEDVRQRWRALRREWHAVSGKAQPDAVLAERYARLEADLDARAKADQEARAAHQQENLEKLRQLVAHVETLVGAQTLALKDADQALRDVKGALDQLPSLPTKEDRQEMLTKLQAQRTALTARAKELREADDWQRWANLHVQEELCAQMEALKTAEDLDGAASRMRELQSRWKQVAHAPRAQGEALWRRFKAAQDEVFARCQTHFAEQAAARGDNLGRKLALCERAEALADSTDWVKTAQEIQGLQAEWKTIGPVPRGHEKAVWERFRAACDRFFTRRQEDLKQRKETWGANLARKEALSAEAESLAESTDWEAAAARIKQLQAEWKTIGPVKKNKSEAIWQRFRSACDHFFERYKHRDQLAVAGKLDEYEVLLAEARALLPADGAEAGEPPADLVTRVQSIRARWQKLPELPRALHDDETAKLNDLLAEIVKAHPAAFAGSDLDPELVRQRMEKLLAKVESLVPSSGEGGASPARAPELSPAEKLARQWREALASNTIGGRGAKQENDEQRWRAAEQDVRAAQQQWLRLGPVPASIARPLTDRFNKAVRQFYDARRRQQQHAVSR